MKKEWNKSIYLFIECCGGKLVKAYPTQPPSMSHNMTMDMPVSHLIRGWVPDGITMVPAGSHDVASRDSRMDSIPILSLLCIKTEIQFRPLTLRSYTLSSPPFPSFTCHVFHVAQHCRWSDLRRQRNFSVTIADALGGRSVEHSKREDLERIPQKQEASSL